jgi:hypothetical protein
MAKWPKRLQAWRAQRQQFSVDKWERARAKGKARYVLRITLQFMLLMIVWIGAIEFFRDGIQLSDFRFWIIGGPIVGVFIGVTTWWDKEDNYKNARLEDDIKRRLHQ